MSHLEYLAHCVEITELICILNVVRSSVFGVTFTGYSIWFIATVIWTLIGSSLCVRISTTIHEYVTLRPTGILLCVTKLILFVPFFTFPGNPSASRPNSFENPFYRRSLVSFYFDCIIYLYYIMPPVSESTTALTRYQGKD